MAKDLQIPHVNDLNGRHWTQGWQNRSGLPYVLILCPISYLQQIKSRCYISIESHLKDILRYVFKTMGYQGACKCTTQNTAHTMMYGTFDQK